MPEQDVPLVSVVTPCLDPGPRLRRCLDSVSRQTHPRVEHIVVDGGSTDGTAQLLRNRAGIRWISEPDAGQAHAINKGFAMADGDLLTWLNADDVLFPRAAELAVGARRDQGAQWISGAVEVRWTGGRRIRRPPPRLAPKAFRAGNPVPQPGTFFTTEAFERVGGLDESFRLAMDFDLWIRLETAGVPFARVPEPLAGFEIHPDSKTGATDPAEFWDEMARALEKAGRREDASVARARAFWRREYGRIAAALADRRWDEVRALAGSARTRPGPPKELRMRAFLLAAALIPRVTRGVLARSRRPLLRAAPTAGDEPR